MPGRSRPSSRGSPPQIPSGSPNVLSHPRRPVSRGPSPPPEPLIAVRSVAPWFGTEPEDRQCRLVPRPDAACSRPAGPCNRDRGGWHVQRTCPGRWRRCRSPVPVLGHGRTASGHGEENSGTFLHPVRRSARPNTRQRSFQPAPWGRSWSGGLCSACSCGTLGRWMAGCWMGPSVDTRRRSRPLSAARRPTTGS